MTLPCPHRSDQAGSLLWPSLLKSASGDFEHDRIDAGALRRIEDHCIREVAARQGAVGLSKVTDCGFRRSRSHFDSLAGQAEVELAEEVWNEGKKFR